MRAHGDLTGVVALPEAAEKAGSGCCIDHSAIFLLAKVRPRSSRTFVCSVHVNFDDEIPIGVSHVLEANISEDARIIEKDVNSPKFFDCSLNDEFAILNTVIICNGFSSIGTDFVNDNVGSLASLLA